MDELNVKNKNWHYEVVKENKKVIPIYDDNGNQTGTKEVVVGKFLKKVYDDNTPEAMTQRIKKLKNKLRETDYHALKRIEGYYTDEQWKVFEAERKVLRDEINKIEEELKLLKQE